MKFAALGRTHWLYDAIVAAESRGHQPVLIGTAPASPEYRRTEEEFAQLAERLGCRFFCDAVAGRQLDVIRDAGADVAVSINWPTLLTREVLATFRLGVFNAHAGDLPRFRGNAAPNWAILAGEEEVVLSIHRMSVELDAGPIFERRAFPIGETTHIGDVYAFLDKAIPELLMDVLDHLEAGTAVGAPQTSEGGSVLRTLPRLPVDSRLDWSLPAEQLARLVRASSEPFSGAYTHYQGKRLAVWRASTEPLLHAHMGTPGQVVWVARDSGSVAVLTGDGLLVLEEVSTHGAERMRASDVIRSSRDRLGLDVEAAIEELARRVAELERRLDEPGS